MTLELKRGVNIEGWLSHLDRPPAERPLGFTVEDAELVAGLGFDHLRINVNEAHLWDESNRPREDMFDQVDEMLDACSRLGLKAVFDLHVLRCHHFNAPQRPLFEDPACVERFGDCWRQLSARLRARPNDMLAYEFLNEPVADDPADWNRVAAAVHEVVRGLEAERTLILGSNLWSAPETFKDLAVPDDRNMILTFHFYQPFLLTHHAIPRRAGGGYTGPVHYPGRPIAESDLAVMDEDQRKRIERANTDHDRASLFEWTGKAVAVARAAGMPLYCGEWGCYDSVPREDRLRWYADMVSILAEHGAGWAVYAYRAHWAAVRRNGKEDEELVRILKA